MKSKLLLILVGVTTISAAIWFVAKEDDGWPDPREGYTHSKPEHGYWRQVVTGTQSKTEIIQELHLHDEGFSVTWHPFEYYKDYWGTYKFSENDQTIVFTVDTELFNYIPADINNSGKLVMEAPDRIRFEGVWFGSPESGESAKIESLVFEKHDQ